MSWVIKAEADTGVIREVWNALSMAINELQQDTQYLPKDVADKRVAAMAELQKALETGKSAVLGGNYKSASETEEEK